MGAAIHAASLVSDTVSESDAFLLDVTPLSLKIGVAGGLAESIIERNTPVPIEQTRTFTTYQDMQEAVRIRVFQGEGRQTEENEMLGQFEFSGFEARPRGQVKIDVTFEIDADGILSVTARDQESGQQASTTITLNSGLSDAEMEGILDEGRADRVVSDRPEAPVAEAAPTPAAPPVAPVAAAPSPLPSPDPGEAILLDDGSDELLGDDFDDLETDFTSGTPITEPVDVPVPPAPIASADPIPMAGEVDAEVIAADDYDSLVGEIELETVPEVAEAVVELEPEPGISEMETQPAIAVEAGGYDDDDILLDDGGEDSLVGGDLFETDEVDLTDYGD